MRMNILSLLIFSLAINYSAESLVDGIVTISWSNSDRTQIVDRFLWNKTRIQLKIICQDEAGVGTRTKTLLEKKIQKPEKIVMGTMIKIRGRIGRVVDCFPFELDSLIRVKSSKKDVNTMVNEFQNYYDQLWSRLEQKTFEAHQSGCDDMGTHLYVDHYSDLILPESVKDTNTKSNNKYLSSDSKSENRRNRRDQRENSNKNIKSSNLLNGLGSDGASFLTWADGYYLIELDVPEIVSPSKNDKIDVEIVISMKNYFDGYLTADEYPVLVFYAVMCSIYSLFAILWLYWCAIYWKQLLKIQFAIGAVILIGMVEKAAFIAEYDTLNKYGHTVYYAILIAEILSCLKRTLSRILVLTVAIGYGIVKPRLGSLKRKIIVIATIYFFFATIEATLRIHTKLNETNRQIFISRIPLALVDSIIYYWIFTGLIATTRNLRVKKNSAKLNLYRHFTNVILFAILMSLLFMIWSMKSHFFPSCILQRRELWVDDAFWHVLFSLILLVIMFLFRPSNNNQRYVFVPLLDHSDNESQDDSNDEGQDESTLFDSISMRKTTNVRAELSGKSKGQQQVRIQQRENYMIANAPENGTVEDALNWVENNIPTSFADQALQALEQDDEIVDASLARSKMQ